VKISGVQKIGVFVKSALEKKLFAGITIYIIVPLPAKGISQKVF
jgi:hypothetical protein